LEEEISRATYASFCVTSGEQNMSDTLATVWQELTSPGQMFEITEAEVRGQTLKTWAAAPGSLRDLWAFSAQYGERDYLVYEGERWTYEQAHDQVNRIANALAASGVKQHDRVAIAMRNYPEWMLAYWAVVSIGAVVVGVNAWWVPDELSYALEDSSPVLMICDKERLQRLQEVRGDFPDMDIVAVRCEDDLPAGVRPWSELLAAEPEMPAVTIDPDDDACIFYTSGTTGRPKGAQLTHRGCTNNVFTSIFLNLSQLMAMGREAGDESVSLLGEGAPASASIITTPLFHVTANNTSAQMNTAIGGKLIHMYKWDATEALKIIEREKATSLTGVPVMAREILQHPDFDQYDTSSLTAMGGGGAAVQPDLISKIEDRKLHPMQGYGMTEVCGMATAAMGSLLNDNPRSVGPASPIFDVKCVDDKGVTLPAGESGEICLRGAQVIKGYLNQAEATAETIVDGWLFTGDIGYLDENGLLFLVDRAKDMVIRGGENVYCSEVENALFTHDAVAEAAVFSVPDDRLGEEVGGAIFLQPDASLTAADLRTYLKTHLSGYKIPRYVWFTDSPLPRNASGKFLKKELQQVLKVEDAS